MIFGVKELCAGSQFHCLLRLDLGQVLNFFFFYVDFIFQSSLRFTAELNRNYRDFISPISPVQSLAIITILPNDDTLVRNDEPTLSPKVIITQSL